MQSNRTYLLKQWKDYTNINDISVATKFGVISHFFLIVFQCVNTFRSKAFPIRNRENLLSETNAFGSVESVRINDRFCTCHALSTGLSGIMLSARSQCY